MAKVTRVELVDDLDGTVIEKNGGETVKFALDGTNYSIDLTKKNAEAFRSTLAKYIDKAEREGGRTASTSRRSGSSRRSTAELNAIREWANANGYQTAPRGRVKTDIMVAYDKANR